MLVGLSGMDSVIRAVMAVVQDGWKVTEVADRLGVSRQSVHNGSLAMRPAGLSPQGSTQGGIISMIHTDEFGPARESA